MPRSTVLGFMAPAVVAVTGQLPPERELSSVSPAATHAAPAPVRAPEGVDRPLGEPVPGAWAALEGPDGSADIVGFHEGVFYPIASVAPQGARTPATARLLASAPLLRAELQATRAVLDELAAVPGVWDALIKLTGTTDLERGLLDRLAHLRRAQSLAGCSASRDLFAMPPEEVAAWVPEHSDLLPALGER